jgi:hypothetical protein
VHVEPQLAHVRSWFSADELVVCLRCEAKAAIDVGYGCAMCTECGHVLIPASADSEAKRAE